jgi:hypothetical protein
MRRTMPLLLGVTLTLCAVRSLVAQTLPVSQGARVRVATTAAGRPIIGIADSVGEGAIRVRTGPAAAVTVRIDQLARVDVSRARKRPTWSKTAPLWLTAVSAGVGAVLGYATTPEDDFLGPEFGAAAVGTLGGALGLLVGTGLAIGVKEDTWEPVLNTGGSRSVSGVPSLFVAPRGRGIGVGLRAAF